MQRDIAVFLQVMAASPPGYRVQFAATRPEDQCLGPDGRAHSARVDRNASLASEAVCRYTAKLVAELASRYPGVTGFRLDWPEYPPYDLLSALFDFNPAAQALMAQRGHDPARVADDVRAWTAEVRASVSAAAAQGHTPSAFTNEPWTSLFDASGPLAPLFTAKRDAALALLQEVRQALDDVPGKRRRLEPQAFPPPFHRISGFPLDGLAGVADAIGIKLYTMHWPMIARFWATDLLGTSSSEGIDATTSAVAGAFGLTDEPVDGASLRYPEPRERHPAGIRAQRDKPALAQAIAGDVPVTAFAHTYGPLDDVVKRCTLAASTGLPLWLNRYGYLSDAKIDALGRALHARPPEASCATLCR
jgi:hypothetical protein